MTLKDTISKWHRAVCLLDQDQPKEAIQVLKEIQNPSAKIIYNLGCISMKMEQYKASIEYFSSSLEKDKYLAISYFQRGVCHYSMESYKLAVKDFAAAKAVVPEEGIDYRQLGAEIILTINLIDGYSRSCRHYTDTNIPPPMQFPFMNFIFHPPKKMVANLKKEDFLGKAKVISSVQESDILYAEEKVITCRNNSPNTGRASSSALKSQFMPRLSSTATGQCVPPPHRPPPRLGRSHSLGDLLEECHKDSDSLPSGSSLTVPTHDNHLQKNQSCSEQDYTSVSPYTRSGSFHKYERLSRFSASSSALDRHNKKPPVPKRPVLKSSADTSPNHAPLFPQGVEFQRIQEALKKKFGERGQSKDIETLPSQSARNFVVKPQPFKVSTCNQQIVDSKGPVKAVMAHAPPNLSNLLAQKDSNKPCNSTAQQNIKDVDSKKGDREASLPSSPQIKINRDSSNCPVKPAKPARPPPPKFRR